jgi:hypothetical protein
MDQTATAKQNTNRVASETIVRNRIEFPPIRFRPGLALKGTHEAKRVESFFAASKYFKISGLGADWRPLEMKFFSTSSMKFLLSPFLDNSLISRPPYLSARLALNHTSGRPISRCRKSARRGSEWTGGRLQIFLVCLFSVDGKKLASNTWPLRTTTEEDFPRRLHGVKLLASTGSCGTNPSS